MAKRVVLELSSSTNFVYSLRAGTGNPVPALFLSKKIFFSLPSYDKIFFFPFV